VDVFTLHAQPGEPPPLPHFGGGVGEPAYPPVLAPPARPPPEDYSPAHGAPGPAPAGATATTTAAAAVTAAATAVVPAGAGPATAVAVAAGNALMPPQPVTAGAAIVTFRRPFSPRVTYPAPGAAAVPPPAAVMPPPATARPRPTVTAPAAGVPPAVPSSARPRAPCPPGSPAAAAALAMGELADSLPVVGAGGGGGGANSGAGGGGRGAAGPAAQARPGSSTGGLESACGAIPGGTVFAGAGAGYQRQHSRQLVRLYGKDRMREEKGRPVARRAKAHGD